MTSTEIRKRFIDYFVKVLAERGYPHIEVSSSKLIPENHPTLLFTNSGMVQFTPYFLGERDAEKDFGSKRLCSSQKCIRTGDLDIVGTSKYHLTFFEMLGNWSIGDYGKKEAIQFAFDLLTNKEYGFGFDATKFRPTVFEGNEECPEDTETIEAWKSVGVPESHISKLPGSENWWAPGPVGPCGPCTEVLYDRGEEFGPKEDRPGLTDNPRYLEIWNAGVFMQFNRGEDGKLTPLPALSVDTGSGLERMTTLIQHVDSVYETDVFSEIINKIIALSSESEKIQDALVNPTTIEQTTIKTGVQRVADHIRTVTFLIAENLYPSNKDQGYVLRRLIRRIFDECLWNLYINPDQIDQIALMVIEKNKHIYPELDNTAHIFKVINDEVNLYKEVFNRTRNFITHTYVNKALSKIDNPFDIYQSQGASKDLIENLAKELNLEVDFTDFEKQLEEHQEKSRANMGDRFKGGLGDHSYETTKLHTATHLLHSALREILGTHVGQMGSNITPERLRFDFSHNEKMTVEQIALVEQLVNQKISEKLPMNKVVLPIKEAEATGAIHFFSEKYADMVNVYYVGETIESAWSKEFCGGPHVGNTSELGHFKILKEEAVAKGVRRIKAVLE